MNPFRPANFENPLTIDQVRAFNSKAFFDWIQKAHKILTLEIIPVEAQALFFMTLASVP